VYVEYLETLKKNIVVWKVVADGYFKVRSYLSSVSDFQLHTDFLMAISIGFKV